MVNLGPVPASIASARAYVRDCLSTFGVPTEQIQTAVLLASEFVTNAVVHAGTAVDLRVRYSRGRVRIEVTDGTWQPPVIPIRGSGPGGLGLRMAESAGAQWGWHKVDAGKCVWFELTI